MPKVSVYNAAGTVIGDLELDAAIFDVKPNTGVIHEVVTAQRSNTRPVLAHTKTRGEVRGAGKAR